jgi:hypothetical protein
MSIKKAKSIICLIIVLMIMECFIAALATPRSSDFDHKSVGSKSLSSALSSLLLAETEEEKTEEEGDKSFAIEIADFSKITSFLSKIHTPHSQFIVYEHLDDHQPSLFKMFCVFII